MHARTAALALWTVAAPTFAAPPTKAPTPEAPAPGTPWPAGPVRVAPIVGFLVHRPPGKPHAEAATLARAAAGKRLAGADLVADTEGLGSAKGLAMLVLEGPGDPVDEGWLATFGKKAGAKSRGWLTRPHASAVVVVRAPVAGADAALLGAARIAADLARALGGVVEDPEARQLFEPAEFEAHVLMGGFEGGLPVAGRHFTIHQYEVGGGVLRSITVGLSKLGLPDLVVNGHGRAAARPIGNLLNVVAQVLAEGQAVARAGWLEVDLKRVKAAGFRKRMQDSVLGAGVGKATLSIAVGALEEGDAENALLELTFAGRPGSPQVRQAAVIAEFWGHEAHEVVWHDRSDPELDAESARARARLIALKPAWLGKRAPGDQLLVKGPFKTASGGTEWMWVEVTRWDGPVIEGLLANVPDDVPQLAPGSMVRMKEADVYDYLLKRADGTEEGNTTGMILERLEAGKRK